MMNAILLGVIQALGEFLPISSSGHLALLPLITGKAYQGLTYDVVLHLGTLIAVLFYFRKDWYEIIKTGLTKPKSEDGKILWLLALGSIPAAVAGLLLEHKIEEYFHSPYLIACTLIGYALLLFYADRREKKVSPLLTVSNILIIGCAQALALVPGTSRSGITITAALLLGFNRKDSARISFLLSTPIIGGAAVLKLKDLALADINAAFIAGFLTSMILGFLTIKFLMKYLQTHNFNVFVIYRVILGLTIIGFMLFKNG